MYVFLSWIDPRAPGDVANATAETTAPGGRDCARKLSFFFSISVSSEARHRRHTSLPLTPFNAQHKNQNRPLYRTALTLRRVPVLRLALAALVRHPQRRRDAAGQGTALLHHRQRRRRRHVARPVQKQFLHFSGRPGIPVRFSEAGSIATAAKFESGARQGEGKAGCFGFSRRSGRCSTKTEKTSYATSLANSLFSSTLFLAFQATGHAVS